MFSEKPLASKKSFKRSFSGNIVDILHPNGIEEPAAILGLAINQRGSDWGKKQATQFHSDALKAITAESTLNLGSIYARYNSSSNGYIINEGQQRFTAVFLYLGVLASHAQTLSSLVIKQDSKAKLKDFIQYIDNLLFLEEKQSEAVGQEVRFKLSALDAPAFHAILSGLEPSDSNNSSSSLWLVNQAFNECVEQEMTALNLVEDKVERLFVLADKILFNTEVNCVILTEEANLTAMYEGLNDRGITLSPIEKVKNHVIGRKTQLKRNTMTIFRQKIDDPFWGKKSKIDKNNTRWGHLLACVLKQQVLVDNQGHHLYETTHSMSLLDKDFTKYVEARAEKEEISSNKIVDLLLSEIETISQRFGKLVENFEEREAIKSDLKNNTPEYILQQKLEAFVRSHGRLGYSWSIVAWVLLREKQIGKNPILLLDLATTVEILTKYIMRRKIITGGTSSNLGQATTSLARLLSRESSANANSHLTDFLLDELVRRVSNQDSRVPSCEEIKHVLTHNGLQKNLTVELLTMLESRSSNGTLTLDSYAVGYNKIRSREQEHLIPQNITEEWLGFFEDPLDAKAAIPLLGNSLMIDSNVNKKLSNKSLERKKEIYKEYQQDEKYRLVDSFLKKDYKKMGLQEIKARGAEMGAEIAELLTIPGYSKKLDLRKAQSVLRIANLANVKTFAEEQGLKCLYFKNNEGKMIEAKLENGVRNKPTIRLSHSTKSYSNITDMLKVNNLPGGFHKESLWNRIYARSNGGQHILLSALSK